MIQYSVELFLSSLKSEWWGVFFLAIATSYKVKDAQKERNKPSVGIIFLKTPICNLYGLRLIVYLRIHGQKLLQYD